MENMNDITGKAFAKMAYLFGVMTILMLFFFGTFLSILIHVG